MTEALRALAVLLEAPRPEHAAITAALELPAAPSADEYTSVLVFQAYPYASVYLGAEGMLGGEARDRIAGFWRALGGEPPAEPDHLSVLLAGVADLADLAGPASSVRGALFWEHVASWMPPYLAALRRIGAPFYLAWADLCAALLAELAGELGPPVRLPLALRVAPACHDAPADLDELLATLCAPVRTGVVIVRDDLERAAAELGLGVRAGERRFALRSLLAQDPAGVLGWLAGFARAEAAALASLPPITAWWVARARGGAAWLDELASRARHAPDQLATR
jgi:TorA maturation chaperone TorD